jgi:hypothetical protein
MAPLGPDAPQFPANISRNIANAVNAMELLNKAGGKTETVSKALGASTLKYYDALKKTTKPTIDLAKVLPQLQKGSEAATTAIGKLADRFASSMDVMSTSQKEAFDSMMTAMASAEGGTAAKNMTRDQLVLSEKKRKMEVENYRDGLNMEVLKGKALQTSGKGIQRVFNLGEGAITGMFNKAKLAKSSVVEGVGSALGLSSKAMSIMTGPLAIIAGAFLAFNSVAKATVENVNNAAKAGFNLGNSIADATTQGAAYDMALNKMSAGSMMSKKDLIELSQVFNQEMGQSIDNSIEGSLKLSKDLGTMGLTFGLAATEAVKLGTKMGVFARGSGTDTKRLFLNLGDRANELNVNIENLVEPMNMLAEASGRAGGSALDSAVAFNTIAQAAHGLTNLQGPFNKMFSTMQSADKVGAIKSFTASFTKIGDMQWAAFSAKKGEKFWDTVGRVSSATATDKVGYLGDLSRKLNIQKMKNPIQQEFTMGLVASQGAFGNDWKGARQFGRMALELQQQGKGSEQATQNLLASQLDQRFQNKQTLGEWQAGGGDVLAFMSNQLGLILEQIKTIVGAIPGWLGGGKSVNTAPAGAGGTSSAPYGTGSAASGRSRSPMMNAAGISK